MSFGLLDGDTLYRALMDKLPDERSRQIASDILYNMKTYSEDPLTWDEVVRLEGMPVWVEYTVPKGLKACCWGIINSIEDASDLILHIYLVVSTGLNSLDHMVTYPKSEYGKSYNCFCLQYGVCKSREITNILGYQNPDEMLKPTVNATYYRIKISYIDSQVVTYTAPIFLYNAVAIEQLKGQCFDAYKVYSYRGTVKTTEIQKYMTPFDDEPYWETVGGA